ncbi:MAG: hypothetical protein LBK55_02525 [Azoarcus sp.]|jgi:hypothetical protein|nr:hypothetical protein [Azoarcus sp.]
MKTNNLLHVLVFSLPMAVYAKYIIMKTKKILFSFGMCLFVVHAGAQGIDTARDVTVNSLKVVQAAGFRTFTLKEWRSAFGNSSKAGKMEKYFECPTFLGYTLALNTPEWDVSLLFYFKNNPETDLNALFQKDGENYWKSPVKAILHTASWNLSRSRDVLVVDGKAIRGGLALAEFRDMFPRSARHGNVASDSKDRMTFAVYLNVGTYDPEDTENVDIWHYDMTLFFEFVGEKLDRATLFPGNPCG